MPDPGNLARALLALQAESTTGVLEVRSEGIRTLVYVAEGKPAFAEEGTLDDTLGRLLLRRHRLTYQQYKRTIDSMTEAMAKGALLRFGEAVEALGLMTSKGVDEALAEQLRFKVVRCLQWEKAEWDFDPSPARLANVRRFPAPVEPMVLEAAKLSSPKRRQEMLGLALGRFPRFRTGAEDVAKRYDLGPADIDRLGSFEGTESFESASAEGEAGALLAALLLADEVELLSAAIGPTKPSRAPPPKKSLRRIVPASLARPRKPAAGPPPSADQRRVKAKMVGRLRSSPRGMAEASPPSKETPQNAHEARLLAEQAFQEGRELLRANLLDRAAPLLRRAAELYPDAIEYTLYAGWIAHRLPQRGKVPTPADLTALAERALKRDPSFAFGHHVLGHMARIEGDDALADTFFARASKLDPELAEKDGPVRIVARPAPPRTKPGAPPPLPKRATKAIPSPVVPVAPALPVALEPAITPDAATTPAIAPEPAIVPEVKVAQAPQSLPPQLPPAKPPWGKIAIGVVALSLCVGVVAVAWPSHAVTPPPAATLVAATTAAAIPAAPPPPPPPPPIAAATPAEISTAVASPSGVASVSVPAPPPRSNSVTSKTGDVKTPPSAAGHRVFLDGRLLGEAPATFHVSCGRHTSKMGSAGKAQTIDVPCGGEMTLPE